MFNAINYTIYNLTIYNLQFIYYFIYLAILHQPSSISHHPSSLQRYEKLAVVGRHDEAPTDA